MKIILIVFSIFIINLGNSMKNFSNKNENQEYNFGYKEGGGELEINFELTFTDNNGLEVKENGVATNPDSEGLASLEEFDPSGNFNPMEMYIYKSDNHLIKILIPLVELEDEYIGVIIEKNNGDEVFDGMLNLIKE